MKYLDGLCGLLAVTLLGTASFQAQTSTTQSSATQGRAADVLRLLQAPPAAAKPMVRWWWFGPAVEKPEILRELQQMKADGIGGAELAFVYPEVLDDPAKGLVNFPFLSPPMLDAVTYAQAEGRRLGLRIDVTLCSGWPYGGPATKLAEAAGRLRLVEVPVAAGVGTFEAPKLEPGESLIAASIVAGQAKLWSPEAARPLPLKRLQDVGAYAVEAAPSPRVALVFIASHTRQQVKRAAVGAEGYVLDPFSHDAVATHLRAVGEPLVKAFGSTPPYAIFSDSLEAYGADWTPALLTEFKRRLGYDLAPHLPELWAGGSLAAANVRHDYGRTLTELVNENYLTQINDWAHQHGTKFRSQTYGEPAVSFSSERLADLPEGEGPQWRAFSTLRWATSANHVFGNNVTSGETFTWLHSPVFRAIPLDMKAEADVDFLTGENQLVFHGWPYSAPQVHEPGWSLYAAAVFNDHNPWHPVMPAVTSYIARMSAVLRAGKPANQVALLLPTDDAWAGFTPGHVSVTGAMKMMIPPTLMNGILAAGYNVDFLDAEAIDRVGIEYPMVVIPAATTRLPVATARRLMAYMHAGGRVISLAQQTLMDAEGKPDAEVTRASAAFTRVSELDLGAALQHAVRPDFRLTGLSEKDMRQVGFIRRRLAHADVYFVANTGNTPIAGTADFHTGYKRAVMIDTDSLAVKKAQESGQRVALAPYQSRLFVFSDDALPVTSGVRPQAVIADISHGWTVAFTGLGTSSHEDALTDWTAEAATLHYSGEGVYTRDFSVNAETTKQPLYLEIKGGQPLPGSPDTVPERGQVLGANGLPDPRLTAVGPGMHAYYEPPVEAAALVYVNGQAAGALWHPPYRLDVSGLVKTGNNHVEIRVYNTALNAWSAQPPHDYGPLKARYGDRFQMQDLGRVHPVRSGILGLVQLTTGDTQ